ncbi:UDP-2,3-diacylglucosamine hydrolase [Thalassolituus maritimus]|uniref:UDP-2,3-diacylglucosamine hydrolase n=1 Tax=Thalassolituus maritimus TaxID=484498 RepID=A0A1N7Q590_9GAMM|nr:UDP-2,3-diacylglucosamine diphosphatase [Thalassolituus maritimus]SIT17976.1 UDP-2,3-diacylglucosamine hydrolase [Thalassolituus maritimus]
MTHYFISDLHLQGNRPAMSEGFFGLLDRLKGAETLYILGDFFEVWIGDDYTDALVERIQTSLKALADQGVKIFFMHGNRDFLMGDVFANACGADMLAEGTVITVGDQQALLMHGDSLCTRDVAYMNMRQLFRNPEWQADLLNKSIEERLAIGQQVRSESKAGQQMKADDIMDVTPEEVDKVMDDAKVSLLIHGHTHRPATHDWECNGQKRQRIVLGDWGDAHGWLIRWDEGSSPVLEKFGF